jgi:hypothetical protein
LSPDQVTWKLWCMKRHWRRFLRVIRFPLTSILPIAPYSLSSIIIRGWYNKPVVVSVAVGSVPSHRLPPPKENSKLPSWFLSEVVSSNYQSLQQTKVHDRECKVTKKPCKSTKNFLLHQIFSCDHMNPEYQTSTPTSSYISLLLSVSNTPN